MSDNIKFVKRVAYIELQFEEPVEEPEAECRPADLSEEQRMLVDSKAMLHEQGLAWIIANRVAQHDWLQKVSVNVLMLHDMVPDAGGAKPNEPRELRKRRKLS